MSIRPLRPPEANLDMAYSRMAPNGRRWSESPIPRVARRRILRPGVPPVVAQPEFGFWDFNTPNLGGGPWNICYDVPGSPYTPVEGDLVVAVVAGREMTSMPLPSGWTTLDAASSGDLHWHIGYKVITATEDYNITTTPAPDFSPPWDYTGYANASTLLFKTPGSLTPTVTVTGTGVDDTSFPLPSASGNGYNGWAAVLHGNDQDAASPDSWPEPTRNQPDVVNHGYGQDADYNYPAGASGTVVYYAAPWTADWMTYEVTWA